MNLTAGPKDARARAARRVVSASFLLLGLVALCAGSAEARGRKYGLFVGINAYTGGTDPLYGCVNDANDLQRAMINRYGFSRRDTSLLTDARATRRNILNAIKLYQARATAGDLFVFTYSGHGTLFPDSYSDVQDETKDVYLEVGGEVWYPRDKYDSALVPVDADLASSGKPWRNLILDDELYTAFSAFTAKGAHVVFLSDSCHSGSIGRAIATDEFRPRTQPLARIFRARSFDRLRLRRERRRGRRAAPPRLVMPEGLYVALTGSRDDEFSLDWRPANAKPTGLFTYVLLDTIRREGTGLTYRELMDKVSSTVASMAQRKDNSQHPQLDLRFFRGDANMTAFSLPTASR
ncbi:MAG TPA: caspase family protein [Pyrinomonadaceae bacterium]|nr:caspase family protein [Pyrinomonadaceae bacterium]